MAKPIVTPHIPKPHFDTEKNPAYVLNVMWQMETYPTTQGACNATSLPDPAVSLEGIFICLPTTLLLWCTFRAWRLFWKRKREKASNMNALCNISRGHHFMWSFPFKQPAIEATRRTKQLPEGFGYNGLGICNDDWHRSWSESFAYIQRGVCSALAKSAWTKTSWIRQEGNRTRTKHHKARSYYLSRWSQGSNYVQVTMLLCCWCSSYIRGVKHTARVPDLAREGVKPGLRVVGETNSKI